MADVDVIAHLYPAVQTEKSGDAFAAIDLIENEKRWCAPLLSPPPLPSSPESDDRTERESTDGPQDDNRHLYEASLKISLSDLPKSHHGLVAGWDPKSDIVLPRIRGISRHHFSLTFNDQYCFIVKDLNSTRGTSVIYGTKDSKARINTEFIIGGHEYLKGIGPIIIKVLGSLQFQVVVQPFDTGSAAFRAKVDKFRADKGDKGGIEDHFADIGIRPPTEAPSVAPRNGDFRLENLIAEGSFATVYHVWNARTGEEHASKVPRTKLTKDHLKEWKREALLMEGLSHPHIVKLLGFDDGPPPALRLEYMPEKSIRHHLDMGKYFTGIECHEIMKQSTSGLAYLHDKKIAHRDISDNNLLLEYRGDAGLLIKLSDLGLSKEWGAILNSVVGTPLFWPPELHDGPRWEKKKADTKAVDVWALGAVIARLVGGMPRYTPGNIGSRWCEEYRLRVQSRFEHRRDAIDALLLNGMLHMNPEERWGAQRCYREATLLPEGSRSTWKSRADPSVDTESEDGPSSEEESEAKTIRIHERSTSSHIGSGLEGVTGYLRSDLGVTGAETALPPGYQPKRPEQEEMRSIIANMNDPMNSRLFMNSDIGGDSAFSGILESASGAGSAAPRTVTENLAEDIAAQEVLPLSVKSASQRRQSLVPRKRSREDDELTLELQKFLDGQVE